MKPRLLQSLPKTLVVSMASFTACASIHAAVVPVNEASANNNWTLPAGTNLLRGLAVTDPPIPANANHGNNDITSGSWATLTDGSLGVPGVQTDAVAPNNGTTVIFPLDLTINQNGYNITSFDSYCTWGDSERNNQNFTIQYSKVGAETVFIDLYQVANSAGAPNISTHTRLTDDAGFLATAVHSVRIQFGTPTVQENGYVGYREFIMQGDPVPVTPALTWKGTTGTWISGPDSNWKLTTGGTNANFSSGSPLTFDSAATNRNINIAEEITAASVAFTNNAASPYTFTGSNKLNVGNGMNVSGAGSVSLDVETNVTGAATLSGAGTLTFSQPLTSNTVVVSGTGTLNLSTDNTITGAISVSNGTLNAASNLSTGSGALALSGGTVKFTSGNPTLTSLTGVAGTVVLATANNSTELSVGDATSTSFGGSITSAANGTGGLTKVGTGTLTLSGANSYNGLTAVYFGGQLDFAKRVSFYNGAVQANATNILAENFCTFGFHVGGADEFTDADFQYIGSGGFEPFSNLALNTTTANFTLTKPLSGPLTLVKAGINTLTLAGANLHEGGTKVINGVLELANPTGHAIPGNLTLGDSSANVFAHMALNDQFPASSVLSFTNGGGNSNTKFQLRGTSQTIGGLDSPTTSRLSIIQNDEVGTPGYVAPVAGAPAQAAVLTINATSDHSFHGLIRNEAKGTISIIKTGPGTQELINNTAVQGHSYSGNTTINEGTFRLKFGGANTGFGSNIIVNSPGTMDFQSNGTDSYNFDREISGNGNVIKTGAGSVVFRAGQSKYTNGTLVTSGTLRLYGQGTGEGTGPGQYCTVGAMIPTNVVTVSSGATLALDFIAALGNSPVQPQYAPTILINEGGKLSGGVNTVAFVANLKLNGGTVEIREGANHGNFGTNLAFIGTVEVGGSSTAQSVVSTTATGANANVSLGTPALPGTTFKVANVNNSPTTDFVVSSVLRNASTVAGSLTKTGPGTMSVQGQNTYTGATNVLEGELRMEFPYLANAADVTIASGASLNLLHGSEDTIGKLFLDGQQVAPGIYGSLNSEIAGVIKTARIKGDGTLKVTTAIVTDAYLAWSEIIPNANDRGRTADADGDGFTNIQEFLFGTSPIARNGSLQQLERTPNGLVVRWSQRLGGSATYVLQESTTLTNPWPTSAVVPIDAADQTGRYSTDYVVREATIPVNNAHKFVRVMATGQ